MPEWVNVAIGPDIWAAEKLIGALPQFYKGMTISERDKKIEDWADGPTVLETDFSKYDRTEGHAVRFMEREIMRWLLPEEDYHLFDCVMDALENHAVIHHVDGVALTGLCERWSGEPGTSIWNGCWNLFAAWLTAKRQGLDLWDRTQVRVSVEGDDGMLVGLDGATWIQASEDLGLDVKFEEKAGILDTSFLGRVHGIDSRGKFRSMADLPRAMRKWHMSASQPDPRATVDGLLAAKCLAYLATDYHSPVLGAVAWAFLQHTDAAPSFSHEQEHRIGLSDIAVDNLRRRAPPAFDAMLAASYAHWYGLGIDTLRMLHNQYINYGGGGPLPPLLSLPEQTGVENRMKA